jgi:3-oxoacyl-[acyl-carrier protein] reductase
MRIDLTGRTALVTGGNSGIGAAVAVALGKAGAKVVTTFMSVPEIPAGLIQSGNCAGTFHLDARDSAMVNTVVEKAAALLDGHIDILINNAGSLVGRTKIADMTDTFWHEVLNVNLSSAFYCTRAALPFMNRGFGRIVHMSSQAASDGGGPGAVAYAASKAGVSGMTRGLAKEFGAQGITVNAIAPGLIQNTKLHNTFTKPEVQREIISRIPIGRGGRPEDVAGAVIFLVSDFGEFVSGETIELNGGIFFS